MQTQGDCVRAVCDGDGGLSSATDDSDVPSDGNPCTADLCKDGVPANPYQPTDTPCSDAKRGQVCDGSGACVECNSDAQCQGGRCGLHACEPVLLIGEVQTRGDGGGGDEFVELYNPMTRAVTFDASWKVEARSSNAAAYSERFVGEGSVIPAHGHLLLAGSTYNAVVAADGSLSSGITDAGAVRLSHAGAVIDSVCFAYDATTLAALDASFGCEGTHVSNLPHTNGTSATSNADVAFERKPGAAAGNGQDSGDNAADFNVMVISSPENSASLPVP